MKNPILVLLTALPLAMLACTGDVTDSNEPDDDADHETVEVRATAQTDRTTPTGGKPIIRN
jgi:hypothetical protein